MLVSVASPKRSLSFAPEKSVVARRNDQHPAWARSRLKMSRALSANHVLVKHDSARLISEAFFRSIMAALRPSRSTTRHLSFGRPQHLLPTGRIDESRFSPVARRCSDRALLKLGIDPARLW